MALNEKQLEIIRQEAAKRQGISTVKEVSREDARRLIGAKQVEDQYKQQAQSLSNGLLGKAVGFGKSILESVGSTAARSFTEFSPMARVVDPSGMLKEKFLPEKVKLPGTGLEIEPRYSDDPKKAAFQVVEDVLNIGTPYGPKVGGTVVKGTGEALYKSAITPTIQEAERILAYKSKSPFLKRISNYFTDTVTEGKPLLRSDTALEQGIKGTESGIGIQAKKIGDKLWKENIAPTIEKSKEVITKDELFAPIEKRIAKTTDPSKRKAFQEAFEALREDYEGVSNFSLKAAQKLKSELDEFTPEKLFKGKNVANEFKVLQNEMANAIRQKTYEVLKDQNIRKAYLDWANLKELQKIGVKAISESKLKGGFGNFWSGIYDMAAVPIKTISGKVLYRVGDTFEFIGEKGITKFGTFLTSRGLHLPQEEE